MRETKLVEIEFSAANPMTLENGLKGVLAFTSEHEAYLLTGKGMDGLLDIVRQTSPGRMSTCPECGQGFARAQALGAHRRTVHSVQGKARKTSRRKR